MIFIMTVLLLLSVFVFSFTLRGVIIAPIWIRREAKLNIGGRVSLNRDKSAKLAYKGICAYLKRDYSKAAVYLEKAVKYAHVPQNGAFCMDWIVRCYDELEKYDESLNCGIRAVRIAPENVKALLNLADRYSRKGQFEKAEYYCKSILKYDTGNQSALFMLGELNMGRGYYDKAEEWLREALERDEGFAPAIAELSVLMAIKGNYRRMEYYRDRVKDNDFGDFRLEERLCSIKRMNTLCLKATENDI
jgi:tetratricopeptide (TPR) repeat protein